MLALIPLMASTTFLFSCNQAEGIVRNVYHNPLLDEEDQIGIIESVLEATPPECPAHYYNE